MVPQGVIVATDFSAASARAVSIAAKLARRFNTTLSILHVFEIVAHHRYQMPVTWMIDAVRRDVKRQLFETVQEAKAAGIIANASLVENGIAPVEIMRFLECHKGALAVMGTHARSGMERFLLGSTAEEVLRQSTCPVVTVGPHVVIAPGGRPFQKILYATDCGKPSLSAVPVLRALCDDRSVELSVLHVSTNRPVSPDSEDMQFDRVRRYLSEQASEVQPRYSVVHGNDTSQAIVNEAERSHADLIVLGVRRGGLCSMRLPPKVTFQVVAAAPCAVLTVSSEAAASP